jgi:hypothetical protein
MEITGYPNCCTAYCIYSFGESFVSGTGAFQVSYESMKAEMEYKIRNYGTRLLTAITNDDQSTIVRVLRDLGFEHSTWMSKRQHPETKIRLWWRRPNV